MSVNLLNLYRDAILTVWALHSQHPTGWTAGFRFYMCVSPNEPGILCILCLSNRGTSHSISTVAATVGPTPYSWRYPVVFLWQERNFDESAEPLTDNWQIIREVVI